MGRVRIPHAIIKQLKDLSRVFALTCKVLPHGNEIVAACVSRGSGLHE